MTILDSKIDSSQDPPPYSETASQADARGRAGGPSGSLSQPIEKDDTQFDIPVKAPSISIRALSGPLMGTLNLVASDIPGDTIHVSITSSETGPRFKCNSTREADGSVGITLSVSTPQPFWSLANRLCRSAMEPGSSGSSRSKSPSMFVSRPPRDPSPTSRFLPSPQAFRSSPTMSPTWLKSDSTQFISNQRIVG